ncbi:hypothetical protein CQW23_34392 [Capsicum baccatum]|uniref:AAA+ ATPase domain-containing protein n=1 Tax=Capsicum baccatum TaxID=33114 RepID=A0A2G2UZ06_CAPBA|nr:hypothetical protein CQW23_34392 [Capsicum baccatum]
MEAVAGKVIEYIDEGVRFLIKKIKSCINFGENLEKLERRVKQLSDKAGDIKTQVENQERSRRKKRTQEVESWLNEVEQLKEELRLLKEEATRGKKNRGALKKLDEIVADLKQRGDFREPVLDVDESEDLETLERRVKQLSDKAIDMKREVENQEISGRKKRKQEVESWLNEVEQLEKDLHELKEAATRGEQNIGVLEKMDGRVGELLEQSIHFGELVCDVYESEECPMLVQPVWEEKSKENLEVVWTWLQDENVSSIGIYGMGGVGKTTLAKHIHNRLIDDHRYQVCWLTVSQAFSVKGLQDELAKFVKSDLSNEEDEHRRSAKLKGAFQKMNKMVIIILDDVWDRLSLERLGDPLGVEGYKLILTTRSTEVCLKMGCQKLLEVKTLNADDAWELFRKGLGFETQLSLDIESFAKSMAERCEGLPLGLITLAGSMRGVTDIREWRNALNEFPEDMESDVFKVLKYSYDRLRDKTMQECFLYCALYPEDDVIERDELIGQFIMEGLVKGNSREEEFNHGHTILNKLVKLCLLEATVNYKGYEVVRMHDLLREMALRITTDKPRYLVRAGIGLQVLEEQDWVFDLVRVSLYRSWLKRIPEDMAPNCPTLSTLILSYCGLTMIPGPFFQYMNNLQVLDLTYNFALMDLPSCISNLESLRALSLRRCRQLKSVPPLGKLKNLRVLDVSRTGIEEVPQGIENFVKLKFLDMGRTGLDELPKEILTKLPRLQYLILPGRVNAPVEDLASLELLEEFGGRFCDLHNFNKFMSSLHNYEKDLWYTIFVGQVNIHGGFDVCIPKQRRVIVEDCTIEAGGGAAATSIFLPRGIDILEISKCHGLSSCFVDNFLSRTTSSRGLTCKIEYCDEIEWIVNVSSDRDTTTDPHCISFHSLDVRKLQNLVGLCTGKIASHTFSGLTELVIWYCNRMEKLFPRAILQDLKNLEVLDVFGCSEMEEIIGREEGEGSSQSSSSSTSTTDFPKLKRLSLLDLPELKSICEGKLMCDSLEYMEFRECPKLKRPPFYNTNEHPFPSLREIKVYKEEKNWWERLEWEQSHLNALFQTYIKCTEW